MYLKYSLKYMYFKILPITGYGVDSNALKGCSIVQKIVIEIVFKIAIEIVIEIGMEQTRLFQCNWLHYADFRD